MRKLFLILMTLCAVSWSLMAQNRTYSGTVVDAGNNEPLIGATVMPIGGGQGAATDVDGNFTLSVPANVKSVKVSYVGYKEQTLPLHDKMVVRLASSSTNLDDVVVIAYGTGTKESLTGSVAVVGSKEIEDRPVTSVTAALEGNAPGVQVNNSTGTPGSSPSIRIRGFNSFTSTAQAPLYVVDGIVYDGNVADINPADIESMSILKDAASCALYGNRGANGVILINTKRAKGQGKVDVTLQVRQGMYTRALPFYDKLGADDWMESSLAAWCRGAVTADSKTYPTYEAALAKRKDDFVRTFMMGQNIYDRTADELFDANGKLQGSVRPGYTDLDWWDAISRTGYREEYNINAAGATEKFDAFGSIGYLKENGYTLGTDFKRFNGRLVANYQPVKYFRTGMNISASYSKSELGNVDSEELGSTSNPFLTEFNAPVMPYYAHDEEGNILRNDDGTPQWNLSGLTKGDNVAWDMRLNRHDYTTNTINGNIYGTAIIPYGFEVTVRGAMMRLKQDGIDYSNNLVGSQKNKGGLDVSNASYFSNTFSQSLTWNHDYGDHNIDVLLSHENYAYGYDVISLRKSGQMLDGNIGVSNFESNDMSQQNKAEVRTESYLGRARYNYDQKYFGEVSIRRDGTSRFKKDNRWGTFWSVGASWIISKEKFMHNLDWVNYLKLRAAYGAVGNDAAASYYSYYNTYYLFSYGNLGNLQPNSISADNLKWESTETLDVALEGSLFNDRFDFTIGYFNKRNADLLYNVTLPASAGTTILGGANLRVMQNIGTMSNYGWELQFGVDIIRNADWRWRFNIDASFVKNKINKLPNGRDIASQGLFQGKSIYEKYTYEFAGVDRTTGHSLYYMNPESPDLYSYDDNGNKVYDTNAWESNVAAAKKSGHYFVDENGREYTDRTQYAYRKCLGTALPTVYGSFGTNLSWKGINLGLLFTYSLGGKSTNSNYQSLMSFSNSSAGALHKDILKSWTQAPEGSTPHSQLEDGTYQISTADVVGGIPVADTELSQYNNTSSSRFLINNDYLTLKNLNISYDLPQKWVNALLLQNINIGFSVDNLFILSKQKGFNPQYSFSGGQGAYYVPARVFSFQLSVKF